MRHEPPVFLTALWRQLIMLNFEVDPGVLSSYVPAGTELDDYHGRHFVSLVAFRFLHTRLRGIVIPFHQHFSEVNLRFYVRREEAGELRRGVAFINEFVPRRAVAWVARRIYNENYVAVPMLHEFEVKADGGVVGYGWCYRGKCNRLRAGIQGRPIVPTQESEAAFIVEHYWGYARQRDGSTLGYRVEHPSWKVWPAQNVEFDCDTNALYGGALGDCLNTEPDSAPVAEGSDVIVRRGARLCHRAVVEDKAL